MFDGEGLCSSTRLGGSLIRLFKVVLAMCATTGLSACQLETQEAVSKDPPLSLSGPSENCFAPALATFEKYFNGESESEKLDEAFTCVSGALEMFATYGRGTFNRDSFTPGELRSFLQKYFLGSIKLNETILSEFMLVKESLLGGDPQRLTKAELLRLTEVLEIVRVEAQRLRPSINILNQREPQSGRPVDPQVFEKALSDFTITMSTIGTLLGQSESSYGLENLKVLLLEVQGLYSGRSTWKGPDWFAKQMPVIEAAKAVLLRPDGQTISPDEWQPLFKNVGRLYGLYLRFTYNIKDRDLFYGDTLLQMKVGVEQVVEVVEDAIRIKGVDRIDYDLLRQFFSALETSEAISLPVKPSTLSGLLEPLFERIFNPIVVDKVRGAKIDPGDPKSVSGFRTPQRGITTANLKNLSEAILGWIEMQQLWERLEKDAEAQDPRMVGRPIPIKVVRQLWKSYRPVHKEAWGDLKLLFDRSLPPAVHPDGRLMMAPGSSIVVDRNSFASLNWKQVVVRVIGNGYVSDPAGLRMKGVLLSQLKEVFDDFFKLTVDLDFLDTSDVDIWKTGFTISNIFLFSSNGDDRLGFHEAVDLFMLSFGSSYISQKLIAVDVKANCNDQGSNAFGKPTYTSACWRDRVRLGFRGFFDTMPGWIRTTKNWNVDDWGWYFTNLEKAARKATNPRGPLMSGEMSRSVSIQHYIEALFTRWDTNRDGALNMAEADKAYFLFKKVLRDASGFTDDAEVRALYFYLLTFGKPPETIGNKLYWLWWKKNPEEWEKRTAADRSRLAQIFGNLAASL